jgi:hypothetical protein
VLKDSSTHCCRPIVRIEPLAVSGSSLPFVDETYIDQLVEVVVEVIGFDIDGSLEIGGT